MSPQRKALVVIVIAAILGIGLVNALALTPKEREKAKKVLEAVEMAGEHIKALQSAAEAANLSAQLANDSAGSAWSSAFQVGLTAKKAQEEAERCQKENVRMRPIVDAVTGPWWFPGGKALIYGAKKSLLSLVVIIGIGLLLAVIIKVAITAATGGTVTGGFKIVGGIFTRVGKGIFGFFGRLGKRGLALAKRKGKAAATKQIDKIKHRTIGSDDE